MTSSANTRRELLVFLDALQAAYPLFGQRWVISHIRRAIPGYAEGVWTAAMPTNAGPSAFPKPIRQHLVNLLIKDAAESGVDLGHVLVCLDVRRTPNLIEDDFASWAGDLGLHALTNYLDGTAVPVGAPGSHAATEDLLGDIDGANIALRAPRGRELDAMFAYYQTEVPAFMPSAASRFATFLGDMDLLDAQGEIVANAAAPDGLITQRLFDYVFWEQLKNHLARFRLDYMARQLRYRELEDAPALRKEIAVTAGQFVVFLQHGLAAEKAVKSKLQ